MPSARLQLFKLGFLYQDHKQESPRGVLPKLSLPLGYSQVISPKVHHYSQPWKLLPPFLSPQHRQDSRTMSRVREKEPYRYRTQSRGTCLFTSIMVSVSSSRGLMDPVRGRFEGTESRPSRPCPKYSQSYRILKFFFSHLGKEITHTRTHTHNMQAFVYYANHAYVFFN